MVISTGMGTLEEIREAVEAVRETGNEQIALLRCASAYPAISDNMNLAAMKELKEIFHVPVGYESVGDPGYEEAFWRSDRALRSFHGFCGGGGSRGDGRKHD